MTLSFEEVSGLWKTEKRQWVKESTYAAYVHHINKHLLPYFGKMSPESLCEDTIRKFVNLQLLSGISVSTVRESLMVLGMILDYGFRLGAWPRVIYKIRFPNALRKRTDIQVFSRTDHRKLTRHLTSHLTSKNLGLLICLYTGIRIGEACALQWMDLDVSGGLIRIRKTVQRVWMADGEERINKLNVGLPKTPSSSRDIPMPDELKRIIRPFRKRSPADYYVISDAPEPLEPRYFRDYYRNLLNALDLPPLRFHALRHSFATHCIECGCDYKAVSAILGHASISVTMDMYVHPGFREKKQTIEKMLRRFC